jgi:hypothetical protein
MMQQAIKYLRQGFSVIPVIPKDKKSLVDWAIYQKKLPTEQDIKDWWKKWPDANIGVITGQISGVAVIDIDSEEGKKEIESFVPDSLIVPIVNSPRGGQHWWFRCLDSNLITKAGIDGFTKVDIRANGGMIIAPPSVGANGKRYEWNEGIDIGQMEIPRIPKSLYDVLPKKISSKEIMVPSPTGLMFTEGRRDEDMFHIANALVKSRIPQEEIYETLVKLALACHPPFPLKEAEQKVLSALRRASEQPRNVKQEVSQWCIAQDGTFRIESCFNELNLKNTEQKGEGRAAVMELSRRGIIERDKGIGVYRLLDKTIEYIQLSDQTPQPLNFKWPFGIEQFADLYEGNIAVVAGTSNAGKTAMLLNFAVKNKDNFHVRYQSSEMDSHELSIRLKGFGTGLASFREKVEWIKRSQDWWDIILPDAVNIIDFMEIHEDFYKVGGWIKKIFDKLRKGIAIIALQKKDATTDMGRGGAITKEKARLYLSIDYGTLTIVKAKNWHEYSVDPTGAKIDFVMERGVVLKNEGTWYWKQ